MVPGLSPLSSADPAQATSVTAPHDAALLCRLGLTRTIVLAGLAVIACSDPVAEAAEQLQFVKDHGGSNREVCEEARKVKAAYVEKRRYDVLVWEDQRLYCERVDDGLGEIRADGPQPLPRLR